jgi:CRP/FNR family cyclic AMP-dependent transcriptional regulator
MNFDEKFVHQYRTGEVIFAQGTTGNHMYVVLSGHVEIRRKADGVEKVIATLGEGEIFGEMALVSSGIRMADAVAGTDGTSVVAIDQARFVYLVSQQPAFALSIMGVMARRIEALGQTIGAN